MPVFATLSNAYVSKGFGEKPQATFSANQKGNTDWGRLRFKASISRKDREGNTTYDNYSVVVNNVKGDAKITEILNQPGTMVNVNGILTQETFEVDGETKKFTQLEVENSRNITITKFGSDQNVTAPANVGGKDDDLPF